MSIVEEKKNENEIIIIKNESHKFMGEIRLFLKNTSARAFFPII